MRGTKARTPRMAVLSALVLGAVALLALTGIAMAKDRGGDDHGHHGHHGNHGRHHHHHFREIEETGTISSFDPATGRLTIALTGGETASGLVTDETRIRCEGADDRRADRRDHGGDDNGGRGAEPGGDNGGHGNEPGDDNGGNSGPGSGGPVAEGEGSEPGEGPACTTASLVLGAFVGEAELRLGSGTAVFEEVELGHDS